MKSKYLRSAPQYFRDLQAVAQLEVAEQAHLEDVATINTSIKIIQFALLRKQCPDPPNYIPLTYFRSQEFFPEK